MSFKSICCIWMAGSSKGKWQTHISWSTLAIVQTEPSQGVTDCCIPTNAVALCKPWTVHLFFALVLGLQDEWDEDGGKWQGRALSWGHCSTEFRQQSSWGAPRKGVERGLRQWVLSGVPLVPRGEERSRGKVQTPRGKETTFWSIPKTRIVIKESIAEVIAKRKQQQAFPHSCLSMPGCPLPLIIPTPQLLGTIELCLWYAWSCRSWPYLTRTFILHRLYRAPQNALCVTVPFSPPPLTLI